MRLIEYTVARADTGAVMPYARVKVFNADNTRATIYNASGVSVIANPTVANSQGKVSFSIPDGIYVLQATSADRLYSLPPAHIDVFNLEDFLASVAAAFGPPGVTPMKYSEYTITREDTGVVMPQASVRVYEDDGVTLATIYNASGLSPIANPTTADASGRIGFSAPDGTYFLQATSPDGSYSIPNTMIDIFYLQTFLDSIEAISGPLYPVVAEVPRTRNWTSPSGMNNPLGLSIDCSQSQYSFNADPFQLNDWSQSASGITQIYWDPLNGLDSNTGTTSSAPWKTLPKIQTSAPDKSVVNILTGRVDYNANVSGGADFNTRRIKFRTDLPLGVLWSGSNLAYTLAYCAWVSTSGNSYKTTASINGGVINNMFDGKYRNTQGLPLGMVYVTSSALVKSTPGSWWWDSGTGTLWVHMIDDRVPDQADNWIPVYGFGGHNFLSDGELVFENCEFTYHSGGANQAAFRFRPTTAFVANTVKTAFKNCKAYGSDGNAFEFYDQQINVIQNCAAGDSWYDVFNHTSFMSTGTQAQWTTTYEDNCYGRNAGYDKSKVTVNPSNSNNITTAHRGKHIFRVNTTGDHCPNSWVADVQGCYSMNAGISPNESTKTGGLFLNNFWNQKLSGEGSSGSKMCLIGCGGQAISTGRHVFSNRDDTDTVASLGEIWISDWIGPRAASYTPGTILKNYETGALLN